MSDDTPAPPKPKPGSLRDRIAAFEKKPDNSAPSAPAPRPKPGHVQWKPRPTSPTPAPAASTAAASSTTPERRYVKGGMSASDAKESIGGGSLKERMAALQGRGAFGAPAPVAPPPKPASDKPKWKPPPVVHAAEEIGESEEPSDHSKLVHEEGDFVEASVASSQDEPVVQEEDGEKAEADPEEEERQRRAAIAARMARLGGARVGMGPPVFGIKPPVKKKVETPKEAAKPITEVEAEHTADLHPSTALTESSEQSESCQSLFSGQYDFSLISSTQIMTAGNHPRMKGKEQGRNQLRK